MCVMCVPMLEPVNYGGIYRTEANGEHKFPAEQQRLMALQSYHHIASEQLKITKSCTRHLAHHSQSRTILSLPPVARSI